MCQVRTCPRQSRREPLTRSEWVYQVGRTLRRGAGAAGPILGSGALRAVSRWPACGEPVRAHVRQVQLADARFHSAAPMAGGSSRPTTAAQVAGRSTLEGRPIEPLRLFAAEPSGEDGQPPEDDLWRGARAAAIGLRPKAETTKTASPGGSLCLTRRRSLPSTPPGPSVSAATHRRPTIGDPK
jgi:hypothetical protein